MRKVLVLALLIGFVACKKEASNQISSPNQLPQLLSALPDEVVDYLDEFYNDTYQMGQSIQTSDDSNTYEVIEIIVGDDTRARGYIVMNYTSGEFLYHADVDRTNYVLTLQTIGEENPAIYEEIDQNEEYILTDEFDIISAIENVEDGIPPGGGNPDPQLKSERKFWGRGDTPLYYLGPCLGGYRTPVYQFYTLWIKNGTVDGDPEPC